MGLAVARGAVSPRAAKKPIQPAACGSTPAGNGEWITDWDSGKAINHSIEKSRVLSARVIKSALLPSRPLQNGCFFHLLVARRSIGIAHSRLEFQAALPPLQTLRQRHWITKRHGA